MIYLMFFGFGAFCMGLTILLILFTNKKVQHRWLEYLSGKAMHEEWVQIERQKFEDRLR